MFKRLPFWRNPRRNHDSARDLLDGLDREINAIGFLIEVPEEFVENNVQSIGMLLHSRLTEKRGGSGGVNARHRGKRLLFLSGLRGIRSVCQRWARVS